MNPTGSLHLAPRSAGPAAVLAILWATTLLAARPGLAGVAPQSFQARLDYGYDSNLLDASNSERAAFASQDPGSFFVVNAMHDEFFEGALTGQWRPAAHSRARPSFELRTERRQYVFNPIRSHETFEFRSRVRPVRRTRLDLGIEFTPQLYGRHRRDSNALPGEPVFRPEVYRQWSGNLDYSLSPRAGTDVGFGFEGTVRDYRTPFEARSRHLIGGNLKFARALVDELHLGWTAGLRRTWTQNAPGIPTDLSNREWFLQPSLEGHLLPVFSTFEIGGELAWRRYLSGDPSDRSHFGRKDRRAELVIQLTRSIRGSLGSETRLNLRKWTSNIPDARLDEDAFSDAEVRTGLVWNWDPGKDKTP